MKILGWIICLVFFQSISFAQKTESAEFSTIKKTMKMQEKAWSDGDLEKYMEGYLKSDSLRFITRKGVTYGWQGMLEKYKKAYPDKSAMGILKFDLISMEKLSESKILVIGKWTLTREKDELSGYYSLIWEKHGDQWFIVLDHTS